MRQQNRDLQQQIQQMQLEQVRLRQDAEQARRLQTLLGFKEQFINKTVAAQVIGSSGSEQSRLVYIDKGSDDGIRTGLAVMTASGVVGKVSNVINSSTIRSIYNSADPLNKLAFTGTVQNPAGSTITAKAGTLVQVSGGLGVNAGAV